MSSLLNESIINDPPRRVSKAVFVGINYDRQSGRLEGCVADVNEKFNHISKFYSPSPENTLVLVDEPQKLSHSITSRISRVNTPTRENMIRAAE